MMNKYATLYNWKRYGLICREGQTYDDIFDKVHNTKNCELCNILLTTGLSKSGKCMDHDHKTGYFRQVLCRSCNSNYDMDDSIRKKPINNTSGHRNISYQTKDNLWLYAKQINKVKYHKCFKTLEEAIQYKEKFEKKIKDKV